MAITSEGINFEVAVNDNGAQKKLHSLNQEQQEMERTLKDLNKERAKYAANLSKYGKEYEETTKAITAQRKALIDNKNAQQEVKKTLDISQLTIKQLRRELQQLKVSYDNAAPNSAKQKEIADRYKEIQTRVDELSLSTKKVKEESAGMGNSLQNSWSKVAIGIATASALVMGFVAGLMKIVNVRAEFQKFEAVLTVAFGDKSKALSVMKQIAAFAAKTPFQVNELTKTFQLLRGRISDLEFSEASFTKLGDFAAVTQLPMEQLTQAIMDVNNTERWNEFGVKAKTTGDKVALSWHGMTVEVERNEKGVLKAIEAFGEMKGVKGTMESISKTLTGQLSNLEDSWTALLNNIGTQSEGAFNKVITLISNLVNGMNNLVGSNSNVMKFINGFVTESKKIETIVLNVYNEVKGLFSALSDLAKAFGFVNNGTSMAASLMKFLETTLQISLIPLRLFVFGWTKLAEGFTWIVTNVPFVKEAFGAITYPIIKLIDLMGKLKDYMMQFGEWIGIVKKQTEGLSTFGKTLFELLQKANAEVIKSEEKKTETLKKINSDFIEYIREINKELLANEYEKAQAEIEIWWNKEQEKIAASKWSANEQAEALTKAEELRKKKIADIDKEFNTKRSDEQKQFTEQITVNLKKDERKQNTIYEDMAEMRNNIQKKYIVERKQISAEEVGVIEQSVEQMGGMLIAFASGQEESIADYAKNILKMGLKLVKDQAEIAAVGVTVQSLASPESIATFGAAGIAKAAIIIGLIEAAFAGLNVVIDGFEQGGQFPVTRAQDGKRFNANYNPNQRGYVNKPTILVGEYNKPEYVISSEQLKVPAVRNFVNRLDSGFRNNFRNNGIPGFESGGYTQQNNITQNMQPVIYTDPAILTAISQLNYILSKGINAQVSYTDLKKKEDRLNNLINRTTLK